MQQARLPEGEPIYFTKPKLEQLKRAYAKARAAGQESFMFEEREVVCTFAKYLIEYLDGVSPPE